MSLRRAWLAATALALAAFAAGQLASTSGGAASRKYTIAFAPASDESHDVYHLEVGKGGREGAKAVGARYIYDATPSVELDNAVTALIARHVDAIVTDGYDPATRPIWAKVRAAGIPLLSDGDDIDGPRTVWVSYSDPVAYGEAIADALAFQMKGKGEYAVVGQQGQFPIADEWTRIVERYVKKTYPDMKLDGRVTGTGAGDLSEVASIEARLLPEPGCGLPDVVHFFPFQRKMSGLVPAPDEVWPTAQAPVEKASTPLRSLTSVPGLGLGTRFQAAPFQRTISEAEPASPTAQTLVRETALTARRKLELVSGLGVGATCHFTPFQCSASVSRCSLVASSEKPTAQTLHADTASTPDNPSLSPGLGGRKPVQFSQPVAEAPAGAGAAAAGAAVAKAVIVAGAVTMDAASRGAASTATARVRHCPDIPFPFARLATSVLAPRGRVNRT